MLRIDACWVSLAIETKLCMAKSDEQGGREALDLHFWTNMVH